MAPTKKKSTSSKFQLKNSYDILRYYVGPGINLVFFTMAVQLLMVLGNPTAPFQWDR